MSDCVCVLARDCTREAAHVSVCGGARACVGAHACASSRSCACVRVYACMIYHTILYNMM